jgi:Na+/proline symporter
MSLPILSEPWILGTALGSLALVMAVGIWSWRRTRSARDFFIAGQGVGLWATALATMSAAFSGFVFLGGPGLTYRMGISSLFIVLPVGFTAGLICWTLAKRLRLLAEIREVYTIPDAVSYRFGNRGTTALATLAIVIGTVGYLGSQLLALAILFEALFDTRRLLGIWSLPTALMLGLTVVVLYSVLGGMLAGVYTDLVQGVLMLAAALLVFWRALTVGGGVSAMMVSIADSDRFGGFFDPLGGLPAITALGFFFVFGIGVLGQPHMLHKFYMMKDPRQLRWMPLILAGSQALCL